MDTLRNMFTAKGSHHESETLLVIFLGPEPKDLLDRLRARFPKITVKYYNPGKPTGSLPQGFPTFGPEPEGLWDEVTILVTLANLPSTPDRAPKLRYIHFLSAGVDQWTTHPVFRDTDIAITTSSGIHGPVISEWILMTTLALTKNYSIIYENQKQHKWDSMGPGLLNRKTDWYGRTVGICGYGSIGRQAAKVYKAMGCKIHAYTFSAKSTPDSRRDLEYSLPGTGDPDGIFPDAWFSSAGKEGKIGLHTFLASGLDMLIISVPLTDSTRGMFGKEEFDVLYKGSLEHAKAATYSTEGRLPDGEGCLLVNIARGPIVQTEALITALKEKKLFSAALDVTDPEPLPSDSELWTLENVIVTPHISGHGSEYVERALRILEENLRRRQEGKKMVNLVHRSKGY